MAVNKITIFEEVAFVLNKKLGIIPILYGSLGLSFLLDEQIEVNDIDILIPDEYMVEEWGTLRKVVEGIGFEISNPKENEFVRDGQRIAFAKQSDLGDVDLRVDDLKKSSLNDVVFYELDLKQYLSVYKYCLDDGYRVQTRTDREKITLIQKKLSFN